MADKAWWDEVYRGAGEEIPWDIGVPSEQLIEALERGEVVQGRALDVCCGTGTEAIYLAENGFNVSAVDVSGEAVKIARKKARRAGARVGFVVASVLEMPFHSGVFGFVNDRGCFHVFPPGQRKAFAMEVCRVMAKGGLYLMRCFSEKEPGRWGPYRISKQEIADTFSGLFKIIRIRDVELRGRTGSHRGYECLMRKRLRKPLRCTVF
jgi:ubiquinone/menaquinone biosynthesis C-methylase UbiE